MTKALYHTPTGTYTPATFTEVYNAHQCRHSAAAAMGMQPQRASVIACRLRARGFKVAKYKSKGGHRT
jgi:hypothetical protein